MSFKLEHKPQKGSHFIDFPLFCDLFEFAINERPVQF